MKNNENNNNKVWDRNKPKDWLDKGLWTDIKRNPLIWVLSIQFGLLMLELNGPLWLRLGLMLLCIVSCRNAAHGVFDGEKTGPRKL